MTGAVRTLTAALGAAWMVVGASGLRSAMVDDGPDWELPYAVYAVAVFVGVGLTVAVAALASRASSRPGLRVAGLVVSVMGFAAASFVAWAQALWMPVLGVGLALVAAASAGRQRRGMALLAGAQLIGFAVMMAGLVAEVGRRDEWADHPVPGGIGLAVTAAVVLAGLVVVRRRWPAGDAARLGVG